MARIAGVTLPSNKRIEIALTYILGVGLATSKKILASTGIDPNIRVKDLSTKDADTLRNEIEKNHKVEGELRRETLANIKRLKEIGCYRGERHKQKLPARGQRTKTNSRTVRGNVRRTMGSGKRKLEKT